MSRLKRKSLNRHFSILGRAIAKRPLYFLFVPLVLSIILSTGVFFMRINRDEDWLYTDFNGRAATDKRLIESLFPPNTSTYCDVHRITAFSNITIVIVTAKNRRSILQDDIVREVSKLDAAIRSIEVKWEGRFVNYSVLCGRVFGQCYQNNLEDIVSNFEEIRSGRYKIKYPATIDKLTFYYKEHASLLGGVKLDEDGFVKDADALRIIYILDSSDRSKLEAIAEWESRFYQYIVDSNFDYIDAQPLGKWSIYKSTEMLTFEILKIAPYVLGTVILFCALTCVSDQWHSSKPIIGVCSSISAILAIGSGLGLGFYLGVPYLDSYVAFVYVILAIEVDDGFMLIASWRNTNPNESVSKRMEKAYYDTATSITITSLTNIISCAMGIITSVPAIRLTCLMGALCSLFAYVYQLTFFGACLAFSGYMEERKRTSVVELKGEEARSDHKLPSKNGKGDIFMLCLKNNLGTLLTLPWAKAIVIVTLLVNFAIGMWGWTYINFGVGMGSLFPPDSSANIADGHKYNYFNKYPLPVQVVIKESVSYADEKVHSSIQTLLQQFQSHPNIADSLYTISWLKYYKEFMELPVGKMALSGYNMSDKQDFIDGLRYVFLRLRPAQEFNFDVRFNENYTDIVASRFLLLMKDIDSSDVEIKAIQDFYEIASKTELPVEIFGVTFHLLEQAWITKDITIQTASLATACCCVLFFAYTRDVRASLCVVTVVLCAICELVGYLSLWKTPIDIAALVLFVMSVGFSINHPLHMAIAFANSNAASEERIRRATYLIGFPLIQGALSTILGLFALYFQPLYVLVTTFKILCLIVVFSTFHSLFVIPVLLGFFEVFDKSKNIEFPKETSLSLLNAGASTS